MSPIVRRSAEIAGWCLLVVMAVWLGSIMAYDHWLVTTGPKQADPSTFRTIREHSVYITPAQQSVLLMPLTAGWVLGGGGLLCLNVAGYDVFKRGAKHYLISAVLLAVSTAASCNPYAANVASLLGSGRWTLSP